MHKEISQFYFLFFQERHHYVGSDYAYQPLSDFKSKDALKKKLAQQRGITLVIVPCWWDGSLER